ncbi:MAG TPA: hypothetical protein VK116_17885, partial [Planctomycetota bacterium]|nr:hypothetical protein [Planctomycetota bacterium]
MILFAIPAGLAASFLVAAAITRGPEDTYFMGCLRLLNTIVMRTIHRLRVLDREGKPCRDSLPPTGAFIIVANHRSGADPNIVGGTSRRWISFL